MSLDRLRRGGNRLMDRASRAEALAGIILGIGGILFGFISCTQANTANSLAHTANNLANQAFTATQELDREAGAADANKILLGDITQNQSYAYVTLFNGSRKPMKDIQLLVFQSGAQPSKIVRAFVTDALAGCTKGSYKIKRNSGVPLDQFAVAWTDKYKWRWLRYAGQAQPEELDDLSGLDERTIETQRGVKASYILVYGEGECK